ncbi:MAG: hypothetical protein ACAH88_09900, partial [Roseimicrobium sp.]
MKWHAFPALNFSRGILSIACIGLISGVAHAQAPKPAADAKKSQEKEKEKRMTPDGKWEVHSMTRPKPTVVEPKYDGQPVPPPQGAKVLFDGKDLSQWKSSPRKDSPDQSE